MCLQTWRGVRGEVRRMGEKEFGMGEVVKPGEGGESK